MISWFHQISSYFMGQWFYQVFAKKLKKTALLAYLKALKMIRQSVLMAIFIFLALQTMILGFIGFLITIIWLYPTENLNTKLYFLLALFILLFLIPLIFLIIFFSEKTWLRMSGAKDLVKDI